MRLTLLRNNYEGVNVSMKMYADELTKSLKSLKSDLDIVERTAASRFPDLGTDLLKKLKNYYERYSVYPKILKNISSDIYHIVDHSFSYLLKHLQGRKTVVTCHDLIVLKMLRGDFKGIEPPKFASKLFFHSIKHLKDASGIISVSLNTKKDLTELLSIPEEKIIVVHNGIDHSIFRPAATQNNDDEFTIVHVGGNWFYKNIEAIIIAISMLKKDVREKIRFLRAGGNFTSKQRRLIEKLGLLKNVSAIPLASRENVTEIYRRGDLLVFPSLYEGFGLPPLEAMACGLPVIVSNKASLPEVCGDAAVYIDPLDHEGIAEAIEKVLLDTELRKNLIEKGLKRAKIFGWDRAAKATLGVYTEILTS